MADGRQDLRENGEPCDRLARNRPQLAYVRHDDLMLHLLKLLADPDRMRSRLHRDRTGGRSVNVAQPRPVWCETDPGLRIHLLR
jgi:hypothetical protein